MIAAAPIIHRLSYYGETMKNLSVVAAGLIAPVFAFAEIRELDDAQIANVVITAHRVAIETGLLADSKSSNAAVKEYAQRKIRGHESLNTRKLPN